MKIPIPPTYHQSDDIVAAYKNENDMLRKELCRLQIELRNKR